jgi:hypothetical protein
MANTFTNPTLVAQEVLVALEERLAASGLVYRGVERDFNTPRAKGDTINVKVPATFSSYNFISATSNQTITESSVAVKLDTIADVSVAITSKEMTLSIDDLSKQILQPAAYAIAEQVEANVLAALVAGASLSETKTATAVISDIGAMAKALDKKKVAKSERYLFFSPLHQYEYVALDAIVGFDKSQNIGALREAEIGRVYGFDCYGSSLLPDTDATAAGTATSYKVTGAIGATTVALGTLSAATATIKSGDKFIYDNHIYEFTEDGTGTDSAIASIDIFPGLHVAMTDVAPTLVVRAPYSVGFHKSALTLATAPMEAPVGGAVGAVATSPSGLSVRVVYDYTPSSKTNNISIDLLYGIKVLDGNRIVKMIDA